MTEAKHTPGPWATYVNKANDVVIRKMLPDGMECCEIARVKTGFSDSRLIASAPEMLERLEMCKRFLEDMHTQSPEVTVAVSQTLHETVSEIIAKATGK